MINISLSRHVASRMLHAYNLSRLNRVKHMSRCYSKTSQPEDVEESEPLKYSSSGAAKWRAEHSRQGGSDDDKPWYQSIVISVSVSAFLIYFCVLREENDVDQKLSVSLYEKVPGLEEKQLHMALMHNQRNGLDTKEIEERLAVLKRKRLGYGKQEPKA